MNIKNELLLLLESKELQLPVLPKVATKVLELINNPNTNLNQITEIIIQDQAIATHVLRIANSAAFAPLTEIVSINQAISRLGFKLLTEITLAISLQSSLFNSKFFHNEMLQLWRNSLLTGLWAKRIAFHKKYNVEATFLGGLLHEVGKPIILNSLNSLIKTKSDFDKNELDTTLDELHILFAKKVMTEWNLPKLVTSISCDYKEIELNLGTISKYPIESNIVYLAHNLANYSWENLDSHQTKSLNLNNNNDRIIQLPQWALINYYRDEVEDLLNEQESVFNTMNSMVIK